MKLLSFFLAFLILIVPIIFYSCSFQNPSTCDHLAFAVSEAVRLICNSQRPKNYSSFHNDNVFLLKTSNDTTYYTLQFSPDNITVIWRSSSGNSGSIRSPYTYLNNHGH